MCSYPLTVPPALQCSFCLRPMSIAGKLMSSADPSPSRGYICDVCVRSANDLMGSYEPSGEDFAYVIPTPRIVPDRPALRSLSPQ